MNGKKIKRKGGNCCSHGGGERVNLGPSNLNIGGDTQGGKRVKGV